MIIHVHAVLLMLRDDSVLAVIKTTVISSSELGRLEQRYSSFKPGESFPVLSVSKFMLSMGIMKYVLHEQVRPMDGHV